MKKTVFSLGIIVVWLISSAAVQLALPWTGHAAPFSFHFGNEIDTHQQSQLRSSNQLQGFLYIRYTGEESFAAVWQPRGGGPMTVKPHMAQRLYVLSARRDATFVTTYWISDSAVTHRVVLNVQPAYETLRGGAYR